jgi:hypothetical protein
MQTTPYDLSEMESYSGMSELSQNNPAPQSNAAEFDTVETTNQTIPNPFAQVSSSNNAPQSETVYEAPSEFRPFTGTGATYNDKDTSNEAATAKTPRRSPSLFERFTGVSRNRPQPEPVTEQVIKNTPKPIEEDSSELLDIPAFLRRGNS